MSSEVLVLNRNFYAIQVTHWKRALCLVYLNHAFVVDQEYKTYDFEDWKDLSRAMMENSAGFVYTPTFKIAIPEVIALRVFDQLPKSEVTFTRRNIYEHYHHHCCYCGKKFPTSDLNLEHIVPRSRGGKTDWDNIVTSCISCNLRKGDRLPQEAGMKLLIQPSKPKWHAKRAILLRSPIPLRASWQRFVDNIYWDSQLEE
ncbi:MAG: HNH endonuclease [Elusimicrobia bacterium]|nr:HNH endonuclease [Elusimicrobiota bacterium]